MSDETLETLEFRGWERQEKGQYVKKSHESFINLRWRESIGLRRKRIKPPTTVKGRQDTNKKKIRSWDTQEEWLPLYMKNLKNKLITKLKAYSSKNQKKSAV